MKLGDVIETVGALCNGLRRDPSGTTVSVRAKRPLDSIDGYVVGGSGVHTLELPANLDDPSEIFADPRYWGPLTAWLVDAPHDTCYVGAWLNDGTYHFDVVDIYTQLQVALNVAEQRGELAIWDGFRQRSLSVTEPQY